MASLVDDPPTSRRPGRAVVTYFSEHKRQDLVSRFKGLRAFIIVTASLHLVGFVATLAVNKDQRVVLYRPYVTWPQGDASTVAGNAFRSHLWPTGTEISMAGLLAGFFFLSFSMQLLTALPPFFDVYISQLVEHQVQPIRWIEYSFSAACLFVASELLGGVNSVYVIDTVFVSMWTIMIAGGLVQELWSQQVIRLLDAGVFKRATFLYFALPHLATWPLYLTLWGNALDRFSLAMRATNVPQYVVSFYVLEFLLFSSFGFNQTVEMVRLYYASGDAARRGRIAVQAEYAYVALSISSKAICAGLLLNGLLASSESGNLNNRV